MKEIIINFFKGIIAGIGNIIPGISGSALLIMMGLYEKCIEAISTLFRNFKKNMVTLIPVGLGVIIGIYAFSNIIEKSLNKYEVATSFVFVGFLIGTLPNLFKEATSKGFKYTYLIPLIITFAIGVCLVYLKTNNQFNIDINFFTLVIIGFIVAFATIIPGISNTVLLMMLGFYSTFLKAINTLDIKLLFPIILGVIIGGFLLAKIINLLFKKNHGYSYFGILGFVISTIPALITGTKNANKPFDFVFNTEFFVGIALAIVALIITVLITKKGKKESL